MTSEPHIAPAAVERRGRPDAAATRRLIAMADRHSDPAPAEESEDWVVSYMDMVTLLMIVFLTLVGMLWIDKKTRPTVVNVLQVEAGRMPRWDLADAGPPIRAATAVIPAATPDAVPLPANVSVSPQTRDAVDRWVAALRRNSLDEQVKLQVEEHRVSIAIRDRLLFPSGQSDIQPEGRAMIRRLAGMLRDLPGLVSVEGHTDDVPIHSERFPSNWELSAGRAASVVQGLVENGMPASRLRAIGYADTRPLARGTDPDSRMQNRRVTLVIEDRQ